MDIIAASAVRQNTFIIESTDFDSSSESSPPHGRFVVPVVEEHLAGSPETVLVPKDTCLSSTTQENSKRTNNKRVDKPDKTQTQRTIPKKTRLYENSELDVSFVLSSSIRKKLGQQQQVNIISNTVISTESNRQQNITGRISGHSARRRQEDTTAVAPEYALAAIRSQTANVDDSKLKQTLPTKLNSKAHSDNSSLNVKRRPKGLSGVTNSSHNFYPTTSNQAPAKTPHVVDPGPALTQYVPSATHHQSSQHRQSPQISTEAYSPVSTNRLAEIVTTNSFQSRSTDNKTFCTTVTEVSDNSSNNTVRGTASKALSQSPESKSNSLDRGSHLTNIGKVKLNYKSKSLVNNENINHIRFEYRPRPSHAAGAPFPDKLNVHQNNLKEKAQLGEGTRGFSFHQKPSWLPSSESIGAARSTPAHSVEISPLTPQTTRYLGLLTDGHDPEATVNVECSNYPTRQDQTQNKETFNKTLWNIAENISPQTSPKMTHRMAKSGRFDDGHERFEDVLKERNDMLKSERIYRKRIGQLEEELKGMVNQCQTLSDENKELRRTLDGIKKSGQNSNNSDALAKLTALESERAKLAAAHDATLKQMDSLVSDNTKIKRENAELEIKARELDKQLISLQYDNAQISDLQAAISRLKHDNQALEDKVKALECDKEALEKSLDGKRQQCDELTRTMQTATVKETNMRDTQEKLERTQEESDHIKQELTDMKTLLTETEITKQTLQEQVNERDKTIKMLNLDIDKKDKMLWDLHDDLDKSKKELLKLKDLHKTSTDVEKEAVDLKSKVSFLKAELDNSLAENKRLNQDREEMELTIAKLHQEISAESGKKYLRNWEQEREHRMAAETDLVKKKEEVKSLEARLKDADSRLAELGRKIKSIEDKREHMGMSSMDEADTQVLKDGNMKLRQMLVERNIQLTNTKHEQTLADSLIRTLELKQKKAEVRLQQLSKRVGNSLQNPGQDSSSDAVKLLTTSTNRKSLPSEPTQNRQSVKLPSPKEHRGRNLQSVRSLQTSQPISQSRRSNLQGIPSLDRTSKLGEEKLRETSSSLSQLETRPANSPQSSSGYFALYRVKQKRFQEKGY